MELLEQLATLVPLPRMHLVRYGGCLAPHSRLRSAIIPTPRQQGTLHIIAAITQGVVIQKILQHLKLAATAPHRTSPSPPGRFCLGLRGPPPVVSSLAAEEC